LSDEAVLSGAYILPNEAWSPNGNHILAKFHGTGNSLFVIDAKSGKKFSFGDFEYLDWSPLGDYLVMISDQSNYYDTDENISVVDMNLGREVFHDLGRAPYWIDEHSLTFLKSKQPVNEESKIQELWKQDLTKDGTGSSTLLSLTIQSDSPPHLYATRVLLSPDKKWAAIFVPGVLDMSEIRVFNFETNQFLTAGSLPLTDGKLVTRKWITTSNFGWSSNHSVLAFCNGGGGVDDEYNLLYGGALFLVNEGKLTAVTESKCGRTQISWNPTGDELAYINSNGEISIVDIAGRLSISTSNLNGLDGFSAQAGPWWSPDGTLLGIATNNKEICLARIHDNITQLEFDCVVDGLMMAWKP
jgi:hypothetical protein